MTSTLDDRCYAALGRFLDEFSSRGPSTLDLDVGEIERLLRYEACLLDQRRFEEWLGLYTAAAVYWVPIDATIDPRTGWSLTLDDRRRMEDRIAWLGTGRVLGQQPLTSTIRSVESVQCWRLDDAAIASRGVFWCREQRQLDRREWSGIVLHRLERRDDGSLAIAWKIVSLIDSDRAQENLTVIL